MSFFSRHLGWAVLASELSHVFCCVLPTLVTILGVLSNLGLATFAPGFIMDLHETLHAYEVPIVIFSGVMVVLGWMIHLRSTKIDCHDTGCVHPPCSSSKIKNARILQIATFLFALNLVIYFGVHRNVFNLDVFNKVAEEHHEHDDHDEMHN